jgi:hypothetical protein
MWVRVREAQGRQLTVYSKIGKPEFVLGDFSY